MTTVPLLPPSGAVRSVVVWDLESMLFSRGCYAFFLCSSKEDLLQVQYRQILLLAPRLAAHLASSGGLLVFEPRPELERGSEAPRCSRGVNSPMVVAKHLHACCPVAAHKK